MASPRLGESEAIRGQSHSPSQRDASLSSIEISGLRPVAAGVVCGSGGFLEIAPEVPRAVRFLDWSASWCCHLERLFFGRVLSITSGLLQVAARFRQAGAKPVLVSDRDLERTSPSQAHDIGGFLDVGREWLLDEHMAAGLKGVHRQAVVPELRGEDAERAGAQPKQQRTTDPSRHSRRL